MSIFTQRTIFSTDSSLFEEMFADEYNLKGFEILELNNDTSYEFKNILKEELSDWDKADLEKIFIDKSCEEYKIRLLLQLMCNDGKIPEGDYIIRSSW